MSLSTRSSLYKKQYLAKDDAEVEESVDDFSEDSKFLLEDSTTKQQHRATMVPSWQETLSSRTTIHACLCGVAITAACAFSFICGTWFSHAEPANRLERSFRKPAYGFSSAFEAISSKPSLFVPETHVGPQNPYSGAPNPERNGLWEELLKGYNIRVSREHFPQERGGLIALADGSGDVWASLSVYHHLHCLDSLRHHIHGRDCKSLDTATDEDGFPLHLDTIRQWFMCQPDLTVRSVYWRENGLSGAANNSIVHECINWAALQDWVKHNTISAEDHLIRKPDAKLLNGPYPPPPRCGISHSE